MGFMMRITAVVAVVDAVRLVAAALGGAEPLAEVTVVLDALKLAVVLGAGMAVVGESIRETLAYKSLI